MALIHPNILVDFTIKGYGHLGMQSGETSPFSEGNLVKVEQFSAADSPPDSLLALGKSAEEGLVAPGTQHELTKAILK